MTGELPPLPFERGATGAQVPLHKSIISNFMIYQDRLETNLGYCSFSRTHENQDGFL